MPAKVLLTLTEGTLPQGEYVFAERTSCIIGRDADSNLLVPEAKEHSSSSRLHCMLDIHPPEARVHDMGSLNGTFVDDEEIGHRQCEAERGKARPPKDLKHGSVLRLGNPEAGP